MPPACWTSEWLRSVSQATDETVALSIGRPYLLALAGSVLIDLLLRLQIVYYYLSQQYKYDISLNVIRDFLQIFYAALLFIFLYLMLFRWLPSLRQQRPIRRRLLRMLGVVASLQLVTNIISVNITIYRLHIDSYELLAESLALYLAINLVFVFWYWYCDYPLKNNLIKQRGLIYIPQGILFPEEQIEDRVLKSDNWLPGPIDYLYFTILSSNCFGSPEGHMLIGKRLKTLQIIHTLFMILVFIIIVARAINTLS
ncbi:MAG: hypothetical protein WCI65_08975 [Synechococcaceae cyanobacterium ELA263]